MSITRGLMMRKLIFIVDDNLTSLIMSAKALEDQFRVEALPSAKQLFQLLKKQTPDLILLDVDMPEMNGYEAIKLLKANPAHTHIPVIFLYGLNDNTDESRGFELGAVDYITKPFSKIVLQNRLKTHLNMDALTRNHTHRLSLLQDSIVFTLADLVESRDVSTAGHIDRVAAYIKILTDTMLQNELYIDEIHKWDMETFISSARLHDLGKIAVADTVLNKPGSLTADEFQVIKRHPAAGESIINRMISRSGESAFLSSAITIAASHHERWDGTGYPYGLRGSDIPLAGRIMAIVDAYDALTSARPYKKALSAKEACDIITANAESQFDPQLVGALIKTQKQLAEAKPRTLYDEKR